jgi:hypothetical protein
VLDRAPGRHLGASQCMAVRQSGLCFPSRGLNSRGAGAPTHSGRGNIFPDAKSHTNIISTQLRSHSAPRIYKHNGRKCQTCTIRPLAALVLRGYRNRCSGQQVKSGRCSPALQLQLMHETVTEPKNATRHDFTHVFCTTFSSALAPCVSLNLVQLPG